MRGRPQKPNTVLGPYPTGDGRYRVTAKGPGVLRAYGRRRKDWGFVDYSEADAHAQWARGVFVAIGQVTAEQALDGWIDALRDEGLRERTLYDYRSRLRPLVRNCGVRTVQQIQRRHIEAWLNGDYGDGEPLARESQKGHLRKWRQFAGYCLDRGLMGVDPSAGIQPSGRRAKGKPKLTETELRAIDKACAEDSSEGSLIVHLLLWASARPGEVLSMRVRDLMLTETPPRWTIPWDVDGEDGTKTEGGAGVVELPWDWRAHGYGAAIPIRLAIRCQGKTLDSYVFPAGRGAKGHRGLSYLKDHMRRLCGQSKIGRRVPAYSLRGSLAALLRERGAPLGLVSSALGHAGQAVTTDHYVGRDVDKTASLHAARERIRRRIQR